MPAPRILEGKEKKQILREADLQSDLNWRKYYESPKCVAVEAFGGQDCYKIVADQPKDSAADQPEDSPVTLFYAKDSGLLIGIEFVGEDGGTASMVLSDYRETDEVKRPHLTTISTGRFDIAIRLDSIEYNTEIPDEQFELPDEIKAMLPPDKPEEGAAAKEN